MVGLERVTGELSRSEMLWGLPVGSESGSRCGWSGRRVREREGARVLPRLGRQVVRVSWLLAAGPGGVSGVGVVLRSLGPGELPGPAAAGAVQEGRGQMCQALGQGCVACWRPGISGHETGLGTSASRSQPARAVGVREEPALPPRCVPSGPEDKSPLALGHLPLCSS